MASSVVDRSGSATLQINSAKRVPKGNDVDDLLCLSTELVWFSIVSEVAAARREGSVKL